MPKWFGLLLMGAALWAVTLYVLFALITRGSYGL